MRLRVLRTSRTSSRIAFSQTNERSEIGSMNPVALKFAMPVRGEISEKRYHYHQIEWTTQDFFEYEPLNTIYYSPKFHFLGEEWYLRFCLYTKDDCKVWMGLYLRREDACKSPKSVNFCFGIKKCDGTVEKPQHSEFSRVFEKLLPAHGYSKWFRRSDLLARKSELAPSGNLTIVCNIWTNASLETLGSNKLEYLDTMPVISGDPSRNPPDSKSVATSTVETTACEENLNATTGLQELSDDLKDMFLSSKGCDVTLKVRKEEFPVNRGILASRSPVFEAMFEADMKEKNTGVVDIVDCHPKAFKDFLVFIYSGKLDNSSGEIFELYSIAHKYDVERLKSECVAFIMENLTAENVVDAYATGHRFHEEELKEKSQDFFNENVAEIISNDKWESFLKEKPIMANMLLKGLVENTEIKKKNIKSS